MPNISRLYKSQDSDRIFVTGKEEGQFFVSEYCSEGPIAKICQFRQDISSVLHDISKGETLVEVNDVEYDTDSDIGHYMLQKAIYDESYRKIPEALKVLLGFLQKYNLPVFMAPNLAPTLEGCEGAHKKREYAIPAQEAPFLPNELKTLLCKYGSKTAHGYVAIHCRGNREIDYDVVKKLLVEQIDLSNKKAKSLRLVGEPELYDVFALKKGMITPFIQHQDLIQIFDEDCLRSYGMPMTTNATHPEWSTQFDGGELIEAMKKHFSNIHVTNITERGRSDFLKSMSHYREAVLGVIEYGFEATSLFRRLLKGHIDRMLNGMCELDCYGGTLPFQRSGSFNELQVMLAGRSYLLEEIMDSDKKPIQIQYLLDQMIQSLDGSTHIALPCNILPKYIPVHHLHRFILFQKAIDEMIRRESNYHPEVKFLFLGGESVSNSEKSIYMSGMSRESIEKSQFLKREEALLVDRAMLSINNKDFVSANSLILKVLKKYEHQLEDGEIRVVIASTSISVMYHQNKKKIADVRYLQNSSDHSDATHIFNEMPIYDGLDCYALHCANLLLPMGDTID